MESQVADVFGVHEHALLWHSFDSHWRADAAANVPFGGATLGNCCVGNVSEPTRIDWVVDGATNVGRFHWNYADNARSAFVAPLP